MKTKPSSQAERIKIEKEIAELAVLPEMNPGPVCRLNSEGIILLANKAARKLFENDQLVGHNWFTLLPGMNKEIWKKVLESNTPLPFEFEIDSRCIMFTFVRSDNGDSVFVFGTDITERRQAEKELAEQARFPEMNPGPVIRTDLDGYVLLANAAARNIFGEDVIGTCWRDILSSLDKEMWNQILKAEEPIPVEAQLGERMFTFAHRHDEKSRLVFVFGADITERRQAEKELAEQARFPEMNPGPVIRTDLEGNILLANAAARKVFGEHVVGTCWWEILPGFEREVWDRTLSTEEPIPVEAQVGERVFIFTHRHDAKSRLVFVFGADITLQKLAERALLQSEKMATLGTLAAGVAHELNNPAAATSRAAEQLREEFMKLEEVHLQLNKATITESGQKVLESILLRISEYVTGPDNLNVSSRFNLETEVEGWLEEHNIPNGWELAPMLVQAGFDSSSLNDIAQNFGGDTLRVILIWAACVYSVYTLLHDIWIGSTRMSEIVGALRNYTYLDQAPLQTVDIHEGIENTLIILRNKLNAGIKVNRQYGNDVPKATVYASELNQVWTNILDNAADALGGSGEITIRTRRDGGWIVVEIEDNGPGIPKEVLQRIFDPFFTTKAPGKGTGMGLATCYSIVTEKHKGSITADSQPGFTRFIVRLPVTVQSDG